MEKQKINRLFSDECKVFHSKEDPRNVLAVLRESETISVKIEKAQAIALQIDQGVSNLFMENLEVGKIREATDLFPQIRDYIDDLSQNLNKLLQTDLEKLLELSMFLDTAILHYNQIAYDLGMEVTWMEKEQTKIQKN